MTEKPAGCFRTPGLGGSSTPSGTLSHQWPPSLWIHSPVFGSCTPGLATVMGGASITDAVRCSRATWTNPATSAAVSASTTTSRERRSSSPIFGGAPCCLVTRSMTPETFAGSVSAW
jgi:hypothetical protein